LVCIPRLFPVVNIWGMTTCNGLGLVDKVLLVTIKEAGIGLIEVQWSSNYAQVAIDCKF
jgi:hypothetical protein